MKEEKLTKEDIDAVCGKPVNNEVTLLYELASAIDILINDVDARLRSSGYSFTREKKMYFGRFAKSVKEAAVWLEKIGIDRVLWNASEENFATYDNCLADAFELLRFIFLYIDRSHSDEGMEAIYRHMSNLPKMDIFPDEFIEDFDFARPYVYGAGDRVMTEDYGECTIVAPGNEYNWVVRLQDGTEKVIHQNKIRLL